MKAKNRILSLLVTLTIIASTFTCFNAAVSAKKYPKAEEAAEVLSKLNIIDSKYDPESETIVTREEFAVAIANAVNAPDSDGIRFVDVDRTNKNVDKLNSLYDMGIISGYERMFNPTDAITVYQAAAVMMNATGRSYYVGEGGGNRIDPLTMARDLDIIPSSMGKNDTIGIGEMAQMIYQMLQVNTMEIVGLDGDDVKMKDTGKTLFEIHHDVEIIEAYVDGIYGTCLSKQLNLKENEISVNDEAYTLDYDVDQSDILGTNMRIVYTEDSNGTKTIIYMTPYKDFEEVVISDSDYISYDFDSYTIRYYVKDTKEKTADISRNARFVYNGEVIGSDVKALMDTLDGSYDNLKITLRDTDGKDGFDLVIIEKYVNYCVTGIDLTNTAVHGTNAGQSLSIDLSDKVVEYLTIKNNGGEILDFDQLKTDTIASIFMSRDNKHAKVIISSKRADGIISDRDDDEYTFKIDGTEYTADAACWANECALTKSDSSYTVYLDAYGKAAKFEMDKSSSKLWAYLIDSSLDSVDGYDVTLKLLVQDGTINEYLINNKVKIDGVSYRDELGSIILQKIGTTQTVGSKVKPKPQLLRFKLNSENKVTWIDTTKVNAEEDSKDSMKETEEPNKSSIYYAPGLKRFGYKTLVDSDTIFFYVPLVDASGMMLNASGLSIGKKPVDSDYSVGTNTFINGLVSGSVKGYVIDSESAVQDVIVHEKRTGNALSNAESQIAVIQKLTTALNSDDEVTTSLTVVNGAGESTYITTDSNVVYNINPGDLVELSTDGKTTVSQIRRYYDYNNDKTVDWGMDNSYAKTTTYRSGFTLTMGYVKDIVNGVAKISYDKACTNVDEIVDISSIKVIVHDKSLNKNSTYVGTFGDILSYKQVGTNCSKIFVHSSNGVNLTSVVVYK